MKENILARQERYAELLLTYRNLLTEVVLRRMEAFYLDNLSLSEIAENESVSRNAIHLSIQAGEKELDHLEEALHFVKKKEKWLNDLSAIQSAPSEKKEKLIERLKGEIENGI